MRNYLVLLIGTLVACGGTPPSTPPDAGVDSGVDIPVVPCESDAECDDGVDCTTESCGSEGVCVYELDHGMCDNGDECDGSELCLVNDGCSGGTPPEPARECRMDVTPKVVLGQYHTAAVDPLGYLYVWGFGAEGQLGYGEFGEGKNIGNTPERTPNLVGPVNTPNGDEAPVRYVVDAALGTNHTCALLNDGDVLCWGRHAQGELGYGPLGELSVDPDPEKPKLAAPIANTVPLGGKAVQISSRDGHTCALLEAGEVVCWGRSEGGALGYPSSPEDGQFLIVGDDETPADVGPVEIGGTAIQVAVGAKHTCAVLDTGKLRCWGKGDFGQLGYGNTDDIGDQDTPASAGDVPVGGDVIQVAAGGSHTCALLSDGTIKCWGRGNEGQLGYGVTSFGSNEQAGDEIGDTPAELGTVDVGGTATQIVAGGKHTCALLDTGSVVCWGDDSGRGILGYAIPNLIVGDDETPASVGAVSLGGTATSIAAGGFHNCALLTSGALSCWGYNQAGQLGYGNTDTVGDTEAPADVGNVALGVALIVE
ncbi:RCC1 domain-containing protein [Haliangium ochraceum]|uniref:Alpha-tubulin suppressor and related RCC1 domain-containing protein-like protein n=1 Tax=Haliangium ochraceum (strain DSM 14365 / JCM 11303 / SMP-2) TaxID=502025 RepID=D0LT37_HALO1|nr:alpha-tubulin suppressor and related RCC1 domain- containing protein-like protein [Haliangium ochraceum]ACY19173.1 Alpha-tubulin suppressor and related RCC1 domain- containing protein-like protein [Haliangium ochraceum DSM 14365]